ncbi:MAG: hypothetical protein ACLVC1_10790 [Mediterraneibacter gnavus]
MELLDKAEFFLLAERIFWIGLFRDEIAKMVVGRRNVQRQESKASKKYHRRLKRSRILRDPAERSRDGKLSFSFNTGEEKREDSP